MGTTNTQTQRTQPNTKDRNTPITYLPYLRDLIEELAEFSLNTRGIKTVYTYIRVHKSSMKNEFTKFLAAMAKCI